MIFNADDRKQGTARRYLCNRLSENVNVYTLQVSMNGYFIKGTNIATPYTEADCKELELNFEESMMIVHVFFFFVDMKVGRNLARSLLEYYRFTNILPIPPLMEIITKRRGRPKSHRPRRKIKNIYPLRPKTTRENAPINYTDLSICYDSDTSVGENLSPVRYPFHSHFMLQHNRLRFIQTQSDPFPSLKLANLELSPKHKKKAAPASTISENSPSKAETFMAPPKSYVSVIDFNLLTRGGLEEATQKTSEKVCAHHYQKLNRSKNSK